VVPSNSSRSRSRFWCCDALLCGADDANVLVLVLLCATTSMLFVGCRRMGTEDTRPKAGTHRFDDDVNDDDMTSRRIIDDDDVNDDCIGGVGGVKALVRVR